MSEACYMCSGVGKALVTRVLLGGVGPLKQWKAVIDCPHCTGSGQPSASTNEEKNV